MILCACGLSPARAAYPERVNFAKYQKASASVSSGSYVADFAVDGHASNFHSFRTGNQTGPYWIELAYPRPVTLGSAQLFLGLLDTATAAQIPANFRLQYHDGTTWTDIPGSLVTGNTAAERNLVFTTSVTSDRFRFYGTDTNRTIRELAFYPPNLVGGVEQGFPLGTDVRLNLAYQRPATSSTASLTNTYGPGYAKNAFDGYLDNTSRWISTAASGETLEVDLLASHRVGAAHVYTGFIDPADASRPVTQPLADFTLQYWEGASWLPIPGAVITGNTETARSIEFTSAVTTTRIRLVTTSSTNARVQELLLFPPRAGGYALGREVVDAAPPARTWNFYSDSSYRLRNRGPDLRLGLINGQIVQVAASTQNVPFIEWQLLLNYRDGSYRIRNPETGLCLALGAISLADNTPVVAEDYTGLPHQDWRLDYDPADTTRLRLVNLYSGLVLQSLGTSWTAGTAMVVRPAVEGLANQYWNANYQRAHPKKGIAATAGIIRTSDNPYVTDSNLTFIEDFYNRLGGSWSYGWGRQTSDAFPFMATKHGYNPMQWGNFNWLHSATTGPLERVHRDLQSNPKPLHFMGFNEPDKTEQGYITVTEAITRWPRLEALQAPLVSPVPANPFGGWLSDFVTRADALGYRRDYTAVHWYASPNASSLISVLEQAYNEFGRPVWLTEFSTTRWSGTSTWTDADNFNFLAEFLWRAEGLAWLKRYSIFAFIKGPTDNPNQGAPDSPDAPRSNTLNADGSLTPFGQLYAGWDGVAALQTDRAYHLHNHGEYERTQNPGTGSAPAAVTPASSALGTQWFLSPGVTANTYRILSTRDGRPLRFIDGSTVSLAPVGQTGASVEWRLTGELYGRYYIDHPATAKRLKNNGDGTFGMVATTGTGDQLKWRLVRPAVSDLAGPPSAPASPAALASGTSINVSWPPVSYTTGYTIQRAPATSGPWTALASGLASPAYADTNLAASTQYFYRVIATNLYALDSAPSAVASATTPAPLSPYETWTHTHLGTLPAESRLPTADPDADRLPNLLEYALGSSPTSSASTPVLNAQSSNLRLQLEFTPKVLTGLTYTVQASSDLATWTDTDVTASLTLDQPFTFTDPVPLAPRRFLRLQITTP